jgi:hypothetical protein
MKSLPLLAAVLCLPAAFAAPVPDTDKAKGKAIEYDVHDGQFEKNSSGLKGDSSYLAFADRESFDKIFGVARIMAKQNFVPKDAFDKKVVFAVIKRGNAPTEYKVEKVTADDGTLYVEYTAKAKGDGGTATFASPLIVSVDNDKYKAVVFIENGKKAATEKFVK